MYFSGSACCNDLLTICTKMSLKINSAKFGNFSHFHGKLPFPDMKLLHTSQILRNLISRNLLLFNRCLVPSRFRLQMTTNCARSCHRRPVGGQVRGQTGASRTGLLGFVVRTMHDSWTRELLTSPLGKSRYAVIFVFFIAKK